MDCVLLLLSLENNVLLWLVFSEVEVIINRRKFIYLFLLKDINDKHVTLNVH